MLLEIGIILMGVRLSLAAIVQTGPLLVTLVLLTIAFGIVFIESVGRLLDDGASKLTSLVAAGATICGVSAVVTVAESIDAEEEYIGYAVATVLLLDILTVMIYPIIGDLLALPAKQFGIWAGLSMFSTGPVTAVGFANSEVAGQWATLTKIIRNTLIGIIAVGYSIYWMQSQTHGSISRIGALWRNLPKFLPGFLAVVVIANFGTLSANTISNINSVRQICFLLAFAGLGFDINLGRLRSIGLRPLATVGIYMFTVATLTLAVVTALL